MYVGWCATWVFLSGFFFFCFALLLDLTPLMSPLPPPFYRSFCIRCIATSLASMWCRLTTCIACDGTSSRPSHSSKPPLLQSRSTRTPRSILSMIHGTLNTIPWFCIWTVYELGLGFFFSVSLSKITKLKIDHNPFAKGFREEGTHGKRWGGRLKRRIGSWKGVLKGGKCDCVLFCSRHRAQKSQRCSESSAKKLKSSNKEPEFRCFQGDDPNTQIKEKGLVLSVPSLALCDINTGPQSS